MIINNKILLKKTIFIHSFKLLEYIRINIAKNVNDESAKKLTSPKLIAYNDKMPTNNMIKSKSPEHLCFWIYNVGIQIIDWIYDWLKLIFQYEPNEHRNKTRNQTTLHKTQTTQRRTQTT